MASEHPKDALVGDLLRRMAVSTEQGDIRGVQQCITDAWNGNVLSKLANAPGCRQSFESLARCPTELADSELVFILADLGRLPESIWSSGGWGAGIANRLLTKRVPTSFLYGDAKQRTRTAKVVRASGVPIGGAALARAAAEEKRGEEARREWTSALVRSARLSRVFEFLGSAVAETSTVSDARADRVHRLLRALDSALARSDIDVDDDICGGVSRFIKHAHACAKEGEYGPSAEAAEAMFDVAIQLLRHKYRLGAEALFFSTLVYRLGNTLTVGTPFGLAFSDARRGCAAVETGTCEHARFAVGQECNVNAFERRHTSSGVALAPWRGVAEAHSIEL